MGALADSELLPGALVTSLAGRDRGALYVVVQVLSEGRVAVADGKGRPVARPKVKNVKHLSQLAGPSAVWRHQEKIGQTPTDEDLRNIIQSSRV